MPEHSTVDVNALIAEEALDFPDARTASVTNLEEWRAAPRVAVPVDALRVADSPRLNGVDPDHARALAEVGAGLPPILVHRQTMSVIDGMHRLTAARINGREWIDVQYFHGSEEDSFALAVEANVTHGLPLSLADRQAAAGRIVRSHPHLSDRAIAATSGLAAKTVAAIRARVAVQESPVRIGRDGRVRPLSAAAGRQLASQVIAARPESSLREIAREAGISVGTARDVRDRVRAGQDPVPQRLRNGQRELRQTSAPATPAAEPVDVRAVLAGLGRDPSLRYSESGRALLRWLGSRIVTAGEGSQAIDGVSPHSAILVVKIARHCAQVWAEVADEIDRRTADCG
ncbi:streptomycin biosynthesis protein [Lentzea sp. NPDC004789]